MYRTFSKECTLSNEKLVIEVVPELTCVAVCVCVGGSRGGGGGGGRVEVYVVVKTGKIDIPPAPQATPED